MGPCCISSLYIIGVCVCSVVLDSLFATPWTVAHQAPLSMGFPRKEHQGVLLFPPPRDCPDPEIEPTSPALAGGFFTAGPSGKPSCHLLSRNSHSATVNKGFPGRMRHT